jgi:hypothetical protein
MGDVVNLRTQRKRRQRRQHADEAALQRALHGVSRSERLLKETREKQADLKLDQHRLDTGDRE